MPRHVLWMSLVAFGAHGGWETVVCPAFYVHGSLAPGASGMLAATLGDVLLTWLAFAAVAAVTRHWRWDVAGPWGRVEWSVLLLATLGLAVAIELRALATGRWTYTAAMPRVLGVGLLPIVQLVLLTPGVIRTGAWLARRPSLD